MPCAGRFFPGRPLRGPISLVAAGAFLLSLAAPALQGPRAEGASKKPARAANPSYKSAILIDAESGHILRSHNPRQPVIPASVVKMMTSLLALEHIRHKKARMSDRVKVSRAASLVGGHQVYLRPGEVFRLENLLKAVMIGSANDAAYAVAEHVAGNEPAFVRMMNQRARQLGLKDTRFVNVNGLPAGRGRPSNLMSARDAAMLARKLIHDFPFVLAWTSTRMTPFRPGKFNLYNTNKLVGRFAGLDGLKTGFTPEAGFSIVATAKRGDLRLIGVVFGSPQSQRRFNEARNLLAWGFSNYSGQAAKGKSPRDGRKTRVLKQNPDGASLGAQPQPYRLTLEGAGAGRPEAAAGEEDGPESPGSLMAAKPAAQRPQPGVMQLR